MVSKEKSSISIALRPMIYSVRYSATYPFHMLSTTRSSSLMEVYLLRMESNCKIFRVSTESESHLMKESCANAYGQILVIKMEDTLLREVQEYNSAQMLQLDSSRITISSQQLEAMKLSTRAMNIRKVVKFLQCSVLLIIVIRWATKELLSDSMDQNQNLK